MGGDAVEAYDERVAIMAEGQREPSERTKAEALERVRLETERRAAAWQATSSR